MSEYSLQDTMPFGKHKGKLVGTVIEEDYKYIFWAISNTEFTLDNDAKKYFKKMKSMINFSLQDTMPFGKHKGNSIKTIIENDQKYMFWAIYTANFKLDDNAKKYLEELYDKLRGKDNVSYEYDQDPYNEGWIHYINLPNS